MQIRDSMCHIEHVPDLIQFEMQNLLSILGKLVLQVGRIGSEFAFLLLKKGLKPLQVVLSNVPDQILVGIVILERDTILYAVDIHVLLE